MIKASLLVVILLVGKNCGHYDDFDWNLNKVLNAKEKGNFVVSPLSVKLAIAMLYPGIEGAAAKEIEDVLQINSTLKETVGQKYSSLMKSLETNGKSCELNIGTSVFVDENFHINPNYSQQLQQDYKSSVQKVNFASKENAKTKINGWCSKATKENIQQLLNGDEITRDTVMMLLNAIFFKGEWQFPFAENDTKSEMFHVSRDKTISVPMMSLHETSFEYSLMDEIKAEFIKLPYMGDKFAMYIIYPREVDGLETLANEMSSKILSELVEKSHSSKMNLKLPKFKFDASAELIEGLKMLNITKIFEDDLHLMGQSPEGPIKIAKVLQKSGIDVNEKGSTAYAATYVGIEMRMEQPTQDICIKHPFMFLIVDESQKNIIFFGKVVDPLSPTQEALVELPGGNTGDGQQTRPINISFYIYALILLKIFL